MNYLTIDQASVHEIEIKKSRFLCYLFPLQDAADFPHYSTTWQAIWRDI